jgi:hypothetical protein
MPGWISLRAGESGDALKPLVQLIDDLGEIERYLAGRLAPGAPSRGDGR